MDERTTDPPDGEPTPPLPVPRTGADGKPIHDQEFFLALARLGKDVWNRWCASNPDNIVTFEGIDFREDDKVTTFRGFRFGDRTDFSGATFDEVDFSGATFGDWANFSGATFSDIDEFSGVSFGQYAKFSGATFGTAIFFGATFGGWADFSGAIFVGPANFHKATFGQRANLSGASFGDAADLSHSAFGPGAYLLDANFGAEANLSHATFEIGANLSGTAFGKKANLSDAVFGYWAVLSGTTFGHEADLSRATFHGDCDFRASPFEEWKSTRARRITETHALRLWPQERKDAFLELDEKTYGAPGAFQQISFSEVSFFGLADFSGREFKDRCDLTGAKFYRPPSFEACEGFYRLDLYGAKIGSAGQVVIPAKSVARKVFRGHPPDGEVRIATPGWTTDSKLANRLRRLRDFADVTKNHDLERDLYIEERKAERGVYFARYGREFLAKGSGFHLPAYGLWIVIGGCYWLLADYGRSFVRPLIALVVSVPLFWWTYSAALIAPSSATKLADFRRSVWAFVISNAVPFVGALTLERDVKLTLLCGDQPIDAVQAAQTNTQVCVPIPGRRFQLLSLAQSIFSALCIFFAGLALRNYFKLR